MILLSVRLEHLNSIEKVLLELIRKVNTAGKSVAMKLMLQLVLWGGNVNIDTVMGNPSLCIEFNLNWYFRSAPRNNRNLKLCVYKTLRTTVCGSHFSFRSIRNLISDLKNLPTSEVVYWTVSIFLTLSPVRVPNQWPIVPTVTSVMSIS